MSVTLLGRADDLTEYATCGWPLVLTIRFEPM
jgi:hypothetical protein